MAQALPGSLVPGRRPLRAIQYHLNNPRFIDLFLTRSQHADGLKPGDTDAPRNLLMQLPESYSRHGLHVRINYALRLHLLSSRWTSAVFLRCPASSAFPFVKGPWKHFMRWRETCSCRRLITRTIQAYRSRILSPRKLSPYSSAMMPLQSFPLWKAVEPFHVLGIPQQRCLLSLSLGGRPWNHLNRSTETHTRHRLLGRISFASRSQIISHPTDLLRGPLLRCLFSLSLCGRAVEASHD